MKHSLQSWLGLVAAASLATLAPQTVLSQSQQSADESKEESKEEDKSAEAQSAEPVAEVAEIVVTGSRIRRTEFDAAAPVTIITSERSTLAGLVSTEEILRASTIASGEQINDSFQGFVTDGGPGANTISLRGLGAQRTLVLVNGRRWSPSGVQGSTNSVDLSAIPSSLVQRVEILKDGASSIYGADAVAGVVNLITKEAFNGFQVNYSGFTTEQSDGTTNTVDLSWGRVGERGSISFGAQYSERDPVYAADREWAQCPIDPRITDQDGDGTLDNRSPVNNDPLCFG
ncbi:MAG: TonB-dependent receptor plug domain-containing protein, partial [Steroidobacteraceae bacterium]